MDPAAYQYAGYLAITEGPVLPQTDVNVFLPTLTGDTAPMSNAHTYTRVFLEAAQVSSGKNMPVLLSCDVTLRDDRRTDLKNLFYMNVPCATTDAPVWSNQENFNYVDFHLQAIYEPMYAAFRSENYISSSGFGIVSSNARIVHKKVNKDQSGNPLGVYDHTFSCSQVSNTNPLINLNCTLTQRDYVYSIEHGDNFTVTFNVKSGGFRNLRNINTYRHYTTNYFYGHTVSKTVEFKFDFVAPKHCSEEESKLTCIKGQEPIKIDEDLTKKPIRPRWSGWYDDHSGLFEYRLEAYHLEPNIHGELIELHPLSPVFTYTENKTDNVTFPTFTPKHSGMFSILLTTADMANNTKIARRLVLYDNSSEITLTKPGLSKKMPDSEDIENMVFGDGGLYIVSAIKETGFMWQTSDNGSQSRIEINWNNHFVNKLYDKGKLLNKVLPYPTQFLDLEDDGVLRSKKYVALDDNEGERTLNAIKNKHGIVKFELNRVYTDDKQIPAVKWEPLPLEESYVILEHLDDGSHVRIWLRATDVMNNTAVDYTEVHVDNTPPRFSDQHLETNVINGTYTYTSRVTFQASDDGSGVHKLNLTLYVGNSTTPKKIHSVSANRNDSAGICDIDPSCNCVLDVCYRIQQMIDMDNCWFLVPKEDLNKSGTLQVTTFNQALLTRTFNLTIDHLNTLDGLEEYSGPTNIRIDERLPNGARLVWDIPDTPSCFGKVEIVLVVFLGNGQTRTIQVNSEQTSVDIVGLDPDEEYRVSLRISRSYGNAMYGYGDMDFSDLDSWKLARDDVSLQKGFTKQDEHLMKAKINFYTTVVGKHENVIKLLGAVVDDTIMGPFMVFEYCANGQLSDYLQTLKSNLTLDTQELLYRFGLGVARGMEYLAEKQVLHRRLAARNILLDGDLDVKISGFGPMDVDEDKGKRERIPIKWMAPECLKTTEEATEKNDVWSYAVVLWEIFTLGDAPYENIRGKDIQAKLKSGYRLPKPEQCDNKWYDVMTQCWQANPDQRPTFKTIRGELDEMFVAAPQDDYYIYRK
ncbi:FGFR1-like protein [Mya arenaria]|uniref:FGFR1-like protein n=1 Tax=Mya arenaria TaxID=6604 RepID=A0ABY7EMG9_MYAAR|nr:FGFR1-like protein [Mya arenaria]